MNPAEQKVTLSLSDIGAYVAYAAIDVLIAMGMFTIAPSGTGQFLGVAFALMLLPVPPVVLYFTRWRKVAHKQRG